MLWGEGWRGRWVGLLALCWMSVLLAAKGAHVVELLEALGAPVFEDCAM